jgi:mannosyltransferase
MKAGCPVVSINCKAILEIGGDALVMASEEDPKSIASAILETVSSDRQKIIREGLLNAQKYSWERTFTKTIEVYRDLGLQ